MESDVLIHKNLNYVFSDKTYREWVLELGSCVVCSNALNGLINFNVKEQLFASDHAPISLIMHLLSIAEPLSDLAVLYGHPKTRKRPINIKMWMFMCF